MATKFLDDNGLLYFWQKIKSFFAPLASPAFTGTPTAPTATSGDSSTQIATTAFVAAAVTSGGGEVNQNAFSNVKVGGTTVAADTKTDTVEFIAGTNVSISADASNDSVTFSATDTTYNDATSSTHGLMSTTDKTKLDGLDQLVESATGESVTTSDSGCLESLVVYGKSVQNGTPTPSNPIPIQVVGLNDDNEFGIRIGETLYPIDLQGNVLASLPDGTKDVLTVDSMGAVTLEKRVGHTTLTKDNVTVTGTYPNQTSTKQYATASNYLAESNVRSQDNSGAFYMSSFFQTSTSYSGFRNTDTEQISVLNGGRQPSFRISATIAPTLTDCQTWLETHPIDLSYKLLNAQTIDLGYIDMPNVFDGAVVSIAAAITPIIDVSWWTVFAEPIANAIKCIKDLILQQS